MSPIQPATSRFRSYMRFILAVIWFFLARALARHEALGLASEQWQPLVEQAIFLFLLLAGYAGMGFTLDGQLHPMREQGLPRRAGWPGEAGLGLAVGWALAVACVLPMVVGGGIAIVLILGPSAWGWLAADAAFFALVALAEEVAFRGYGFQRFEQAVGRWERRWALRPSMPSCKRFCQDQATPASPSPSLLSLVLSTAYLRTRALWLSWGINFAGRPAARCSSGLPSAATTAIRRVVQGNPMGPFWLTGGGFGLDGSWVAFVLLLVALPVVYRLTRELDYRWNAPVIVPGWHSG